MCVPTHLYKIIIAENERGKPLLGIIMRGEIFSVIHDENTCIFHANIVIGIAIHHATSDYFFNHIHRQLLAQLLGWEISLNA